MELIPDPREVKRAISIEEFDPSPEQECLPRRSEQLEASWMGDWRELCAQAGSSSELEDHSVLDV